MDKNFKMDNLREIREKKGITQINLSIEIEVSQEMISHYEIGESKPNIDNLIKLADYFKCSTDYLLNRTNIPTMLDNINKYNMETADLIYKYNALSDEDKQHLISYLNHLYEKQ